MSEHFVEFRDVCKYYQMGENRIAAANHINFAIEKGEFCIIVGPSGAGKTTVLNMLGGMDSCDEGKIFLDGQEISAYNARQLTQYRRYDVGFVFQFYNLVQNLTALENVELANEISKDPLPADKTLELVGLGHRINNFPAQMSGGEQQRVSIARALVNNPRLIIADEPTGNLDPARSLELMTLFEKINELGTTVLIVTHEKGLVDEFEKRVVMIDKGEVVSDQTGGYYQL